MTRRGFTLVEVLIAIGLMVLLAALMANFGVTLADRKARIASVGSQVGSVSTVFTHLDAALTAADANGSGVRVSETSLTVSSRRVFTSTGVSELEELAMIFDEAGGVLAVSRPGTDSDMRLTGIDRIEFRAYDGRAWGDFNAASLPQALEVSVWLTKASGDAPPAEDAETGPAFANSSLYTEDETDETPPDRWRVFSLVDTLPEVGS